MRIFHYNDPEIQELLLHLHYLFDLPDGLTAIEMRIETHAPVQLVLEICPQQEDEE